MKIYGVLVLLCVMCTASSFLSAFYFRSNKDFAGLAVRQDPCRAVSVDEREALLKGLERVSDSERWWAEPIFLWLANVSAEVTWGHILIKNQAIVARPHVYKLAVQWRQIHKNKNYWEWIAFVQDIGVMIDDFVKRSTRLIPEEIATIKEMGNVANYDAWIIVTHMRFLTFMLPVEKRGPLLSSLKSILEGNRELSVDSLNFGDEGAVFQWTIRAESFLSNKSIALRKVYAEVVHGLRQLTVSELEEFSGAVVFFPAKDVSIAV